jgi:tripartite-type tricarboxylate transporter receptor subunit TctC
VPETRAHTLLVNKAGMMFGRISSLRWLTFLAIAGAHNLAHAQSVEQFYRGKTIDLIIGLSPGGGYDAYARLVARFMTKYIPGNPAIVARNMPGAGSRTAAAYIYNIAPKDGTALGSTDQSFPLQQALGDPTIRFDNNKLVWIGNPDSDNNTVVTWHTSGVRNIDDAKRVVVAMGSTGINTSSQYVQAMNNIAGTKFKIIMGYPGANEINLAMENGEVGGRGSNSYASWKATKAAWLRDKKINLILQIGIEKNREIPDVPLLTDFARDERDRAAFLALSAPPTIGRPIFTSPGTPADRVRALREAFDAVMKDREFLEQARAQNLEIDPVPGAKLQDIVSRMTSLDTATAERLQTIVAGLEDGPK